MERSARARPGDAIGRMAALALGALVLCALTGSGADSPDALGAGSSRADSSVAHECHLFGYVFDSNGGSAGWLAALCENLYGKTIPTRDPMRAARDGWGFAYFLTPPAWWIQRPIMIRSGAPANEDEQRWNAAREEIAAFGLAQASAILGHVRSSSSGPDSGSLPDPHPFADSLGGRWWCFAHNGRANPDSMMALLDPLFLARHPVDYAPIAVDSELLFRYFLQTIEQVGDVRAGMLAALHRVRTITSLVNICLTDGDTLWAAHSFQQIPMYYGTAGDSTAWWASTVSEGSQAHSMQDDCLYWFAPGTMGSQSYE
jgi:predicted glutamine amidotransferase